MPERDKDNRHGASRRDFLAGAGLTGVAVAAGGFPVVVPSIFPVAALAARERSLTDGRHALELGRSAGDLVTNLSGGMAFGEVINERAGADGIVHKHLGAVRYEDITLECGTGMSEQFYEWIKGWFEGKAQRQDGAMVVVDSANKEQSRTNFFHGLITEFGFPTLDADSKDAANMTIKISPEFTRRATPGGQLKMRSGTSTRKKWLPANFKLQVGDLDCTRVSKIEAITLKQKAVSQAVGVSREPTGPGPIEVSNLVITMSESHSQDFYNWHEDFVIKGNNGDDREKSGTLEVLTPDLKTTLFTLHFAHLGIFKVGPEAVVSGSSTSRPVKAEMYCEHISFDYGPSASA